MVLTHVTRRRARKWRTRCWQLDGCRPQSSENTTSGAGQSIARKANPFALESWTEYFRGDSGGDDAIRERLRDDRAGRDNRLLPHVGEDDRAGADPRAGADRDHRALAALLADRLRRVVEVVCLAAGRYLHVGREQDVRFEMDEAELTARSDVDVLVEDRAGLREERTKLDEGSAMATREHALEKRAAEVLAGDAGE